jgi:hypothetical protein
MTTEGKEAQSNEVLFLYHARGVCFATFVDEEIC